MAVRRTVRAPSLARLASLGSLAALTLAAGSARAEMSLRWEAPEACPQRAEVLDRIRALTGSSLEKTDELSVEGSIERADGRYTLTLLVRDGRDARKRVIASERCADLAGAAAVTLALLLGIDVSSGSSGDGATGSTAPNDGTATDGRGSGNGTSERAGEDAQRGATGSLAPPTESAPSNAPPAPNESTLGPSKRWSVVIRAPFVSVDAGPLPHPAFGLGLGVGVRLDAWQVTLAGRISQEQTVDAPPPNESSGAALDRVAAELSGCYGFRTHALEIAPCATVTLEHVTARGYGAGVSPKSARAAWPALGLGVLGRYYPWESLAFFAGVGGSIELSRPRLVIEGLGSVGELEPLSAGAAVGAEWIF